MKGKKIKNKFKFNKLFLYIFWYTFYLFLFIIAKLNNLKIYKFYINFNYILFPFIFSTVKPNIRKPIFPNISFFFGIFLEPNRV